MTEDNNKICKCGHKFTDHRKNLKECFVIKKIKGSYYQCICNDFEESTVPTGGKGNEINK